MKRTVTVLQSDIDAGSRSEPRACAVARAANRDLADLLGSDGFFSALKTSLWFLTEGDTLANARIFCLLPREATTFITRFDNGAPVAPFKFEVEADL